MSLSFQAGVGLRFSFSAFPESFLAFALELELQSELEVPLRISSEIRCRVYDTRIAVRVRRIPEEIIRVSEVYVVEQIYHFRTEFKLFAFAEPEFLEERGIGSPIVWSAQRVSLKVAECSNSRFCEDGRIKPTVLSALADLWIAYQIGTIRTRV